ncbi:nuclear receptor coactivator 4-like isoform X1 [Diadema antillarum]|uniref:nuclear receptor coactivator 4-like isoform X1 n=1 Tax=Diadema antillarum TaxID=105358 RepID=UPI003A84EE00
MDSRKQCSALQNLEQRLALIQSALTDLDEVREQLQDNASETKGDIQLCFSRQFESLRCREVHLLNQVDTIHQVKREHFQLQAEELKRELGALEILVNQIKFGKAGVSLQEVDNIMKRFQQLQLSHDEDAALQFEGNSKELKKVIQSFGSVNPKRPRIEKDNETSAPRQIMKPFEEFAGSQVWLREHSGPHDGKMDEMPCIIYPVFLEETDKSAWLLKGSNGDFAMVTADDGDDTSMMQHEDGGSAHSKAVESYFANILNSPNVTWIKPKSNKAPVGVSRHHLEKSTHFVPSGSTKDWLRKSPACPQDEQPMEVQGNNTCNTSQKPAKAIEIEDLADLACVQETPTRATVPCQPKTSPPKRGKQEKKASKGDCNQTSCCSTSSPGSSDEKPSSSLRIDDVCKGNEKCKSFDECLCDENCRDAAKPSNHFTGIPESSKNQWLKRDPPSTEGSPAGAEVEMKKSGQAMDWLVSDTIPTNDYESSIISGFLKWKLEENLAWLKKPSDGCTSATTTRPTSSEKREVTKWLLKKGEDDEEMGTEDNKTAMEGQKTEEEWLIPRPLLSSVMAFKEPATDATKWLVSGEKTKAEEEPMAIPQQEATEKWLMAQASGSTLFKTRAIGFPYFTIPMDVNQWLQK